MDKKIRAAAENDNMQGYDEKSWQGMEQLLDTHLPQKKSRRRIAFFLLFGLLLVGVPTFFVLRNTSSDSDTLSTANTPAAEQKAGNNSNIEAAPSATQQKPVSPIPATNSTAQQTTRETSAPDGSTTIANPTNKATATDQSLTGNTNTITKNDKAGQKVNQPDKTTIAPTTVAEKRKAATNNNKASTKYTVKNSGVSKSKLTAVNTQPKTSDQPVKQPTVETEQPKDIAYNEPNTKTDPTQAPTSVVTAPANKPVATDVTATDSKAPVKTELTDSTATVTENPVVKNEKKKGSFASKFSITASAGPDYSSVASRPGQWRGQYGFGVGYSISDKWSVRTGFYVARKVYTADTTSYKAPGNGPYLFKLDEIKANCLVYEVPVSVVYNFANGKKHSWFVSGGLSSYFMKSEKYDYIYKYQSMTETHKYGFKNENTHLFSILGLSAGYQYNFNRRLSLMAEPYVKIPLSGVGQGSVKLKSVGALFTLSYKPFAPR